MTKIVQLAKDHDNKIYVMGAANVGKSSFFNRLLEKKYTVKHDNDNSSNDKSSNNTNNNNNNDNGTVDTNSQSKQRKKKNFKNLTGEDL